MRILSPPLQFQYLFRNHSQSCDKTEHLGAHLNLPNPRLGPKIRIGIVALVARALGMKADYVSRPVAGQLRKYAKRKFIEGAFFRYRFIARGKKGWIHRPPPHDQVYKQPER